MDIEFSSPLSAVSSQLGLMQVLCTSRKQGLTPHLMLSLDATQKAPLFHGRIWRLRSAVLSQAILT